MAHFTLGVIVDSLDDVDRVLDKYLVDNENFFERMPYYSKENYINTYRQTMDPNEKITDEEIWQKAILEYGQELVDDNTIYYYMNPYGMIDYYRVGGRWANSLKIKSCVEDYRGFDANFDEKKKTKYKLVDGAKIKDIEWKKMNTPKKQDIIDKTNFWRHYIELRDGTKNNYYPPEYYLTKYGTLDNYITKSSLFMTHAILDGIADEWYEASWDDREDNEDYSKTFYDLIEREDNQDRYFVLVDCHI